VLHELEDRLAGRRGELFDTRQIVVI